MAEEDLLKAVKGPGGLCKIFNFVPGLRNAPHAARKLIRGLLCHNPERRFTVDEALAVSVLYLVDH